MALDDQILPAMAAGRPPDADDDCPECGRPWRDPYPERPHLDATFPWRAVLLAVIGLALMVTFGLRAGRASVTLPS